MATTPLDNLDVDQVVSLLEQWRLDRSMADQYVWLPPYPLSTTTLITIVLLNCILRFREGDIDGGCLVQTGQEGLNEQEVRDEKRSFLVPYFFFIKAFLSALYCLPLCLGNLKRGVKCDLRDHFKVGNEAPWWPFTSTTANISVLQSEQFLGKSGKRTMFDITARSLVSTKEFSDLDEEELILLPGTILQVVAIFDAGNGLVIIQMKEKEPFTPMMDLIHPALKTTPVPVRPPAAATPNLETVLAASPTPSQVLSLMKQQDADLLQLVLQKIQVLCREDEAEQQLTYLNACRVVLHPAHADVQEKGLGPMRNLPANNTKAKQ